MTPCRLCEWYGKTTVSPTDDEVKMIACLRGAYCAPDPAVGAWRIEHFGSRLADCPGAEPALSGDRRLVWSHCYHIGDVPHLQAAARRWQVRLVLGTVRPKFLTMRSHSDPSSDIVWCWNVQRLKPDKAFKVPYDLAIQSAHVRLARGWRHVRGTIMLGTATSGVAASDDLARRVARATWRPIQRDDLVTLLLRGGYRLLSLDDAPMREALQREPIRQINIYRGPRPELMACKILEDGEILWASLPPGSPSEAEPDTSPAGGDLAHRR